MSRVTARGRTTVRRRAKDGNDGIPGKDGAYTAFIYKRSNTTPATPTGQTIPPTGWALSPDIGTEEISLNFSFSGNWSRSGNEVYIEEGKVAHSGFLAERISFTTKSADTTITVLLTVNSENSYDWLYIGNLDSAVATSSYKNRISGANKTLTVSLHAATAGAHFFEVAFGKDSSMTASGEMASARITKVVGQASGTVWFSQALVQNGQVGTWSVPAPMQGAKGDQGEVGATVRHLVWKAGVEYRNDILGGTTAPDGNKYIDICTNKDIALYGDTSLKIMVCQKTHTSSSSIPFSSGTYWQTVNQMQPMITALILAQTINATFIDVESIAAKTAFANALIANTAFIERLSAIEATIEKLTVGMVDTAPSATKNKVRVDGDGISMFDSNGYKKVRINNKSIINEYSELISSTYGNYISSGMEKSRSLSKYIYSSGVTVYLYTSERAALYNLAWCDKGSTISIDSVKMSFKFSSSQISDAEFHSNHPGFALKLMKDGTAVNTYYLGPSKTLKTGDSHEVSYDVSLDYTCPEDGYYYIEIVPYNGSSMYVISPSKATGATTLDITTTLYFSYRRSNSEVTHIGNNGMMQMTSSGFFISSANEFIIKRGETMLKITRSGIQKSLNSGNSWTTL